MVRKMRFRLVTPTRGEHEDPGGVMPRRLQRRQRCCRWPGLGTIVRTMAGACRRGRGFVSAAEGARHALECQATAALRSIPATEAKAIAVTSSAPRVSPMRSRARCTWPCHRRHGMCSSTVSARRALSCRFAAVSFGQPLTLVRPVTCWTGSIWRCAFSMSPRPRKFPESPAPRPPCPPACAAKSAGNSGRKSHPRTRYIATETASLL
jgi:hypothetical protein